MDALSDDNRSTLPGFSVYETPVLVASRCGEREAEGRRELRIAWRQQHPGVHVAGPVVLRRGGRDEGLRVEELPGWPAGLRFGHSERGRLLSAGKRHGVDLKRVAHRPRDCRAARNNQGFASEAEHRVALSAIPDERHNESRAVTFNVKLGEARASRGEGCGLLCAPPLQCSGRRALRLGRHDHRPPHAGVNAADIRVASGLGERQCVREPPVRAGHARVVIPGAVVALVAGGKQDQGIPIHLVPLRNGERRRGAPTQQGDVVKALKHPGDGVTDTDLERLGKERVGVDAGIGGGPTDDHGPMGGSRRMSGCRREERAKEIGRPSHGKILRYWLRAVPFDARSQLAPVFPFSRTSTPMDLDTFGTSVKYHSMTSSAFFANGDRQSRNSSVSTASAVAGTAPACASRAIAMLCATCDLPPTASATYITSKPSFSACTLANVRQISVWSPAMISRLRPVFFTASLKARSSNAFIDVRSITGTPASSARIDGSVGPLKPA